jgi:hypothetical protein
VGGVGVKRVRRSTVPVTVPVLTLRPERSH